MRRITYTYSPHLSLLDHLFEDTAFPVFFASKEPFFIILYLWSKPLCTPK